MIIGITGLLGAGKDTVAEILVKKNFAHFSLSNEVRYELKKAKIPETIDNLVAMGIKIKNQFGFAELAKRALKKCQGKNCVLTSIRTTNEVKYLKNKKNFILLNISCPAKIRHKRILKRNRPSDQAFKIFHKFIEKEREQFFGTGAKLNLQATIKMSDLTIDNSHDIKELKRKIDEIIQKLY